MNDRIGLIISTDVEERSTKSISDSNDKVKIGGDLTDGELMASKPSLEDTQSSYWDKHRYLVLDELRFIYSTSHCSY
jgi:hypothetical protein